MLTEKDIQRHKRQLERERKHLLNRVKNTGSTVNLADERDTDDADIIVHIQTREQELWLKDELHQRLYEIEHALKRIAEGTYGKCENCGAEIDPDRLEILPETTLCVPCRELIDKRAQVANWATQVQEETETEEAAGEEEQVAEAEESEESEEELAGGEEEAENLLLETKEENE
jgi:RNA polymerase-binding protein DksA